MTKTKIVAAGLMICVLTGSSLAQDKAATNYISSSQAYEAWRSSTNENGKKAAFAWLETNALSCPLKDLVASLSHFSQAAVTGPARDAYLAVCAKRNTPDLDPSTRQALTIQIADCHIAARNPEAAVAALTNHLNSTDLTLPLRFIVLGKTALVLADNLGKPAEAAKIWADAIALVSAEKEPAILADMLNARASILHGRLQDRAGAESDMRRVLALSNSCPINAYAAALDRLVAILNETGRNAEAVSSMLLLFRHSSIANAGCARKFIDSGASAAQMEEALNLLRAHIPASFTGVAELQSRIERVMPEVVELLLALGRPDEAIGECRAYALSAQDRIYPQAVELAARSLKALDGNLGRANALLEFHGATPPPKGITNPLLDFPALTDSVRAGAAKEPVAPADWGGWLNRAALLAWLDRPADSMDAARSAFACCPMVSNTLQVCANAVARPILVATRDPAMGQRLVDFLLVGAVGPDGKIGTADDIADPFPEARRMLSYAVKPELPVQAQK